MFSDCVCNYLDLVLDVKFFCSWWLFSCQGISGEVHGWNASHLWTLKLFCICSFSVDRIHGSHQTFKGLRTWVSLRTTRLRFCPLLKWNYVDATLKLRFDDLSLNIGCFQYLWNYWGPGQRIFLLVVVCAARNLCGCTELWCVWPLGLDLTLTDSIRL